MNYIKLISIILLIGLFFCFLSWVQGEDEKTDDEFLYRKDLYSYKLFH